MNDPAEELDKLAAEEQSKAVFDGKVSYIAIITAIALIFLSILLLSACSPTCDILTNDNGMS